MSEGQMSEEVKPKRKKYVPAVGPKLQKLLAVVFGLFAVLVVNSVYLASVTVAGPEYQNWFYLNMFLLHLVLGLLIVIPVIAFGVIHIRNTKNRKNWRAIRVGYALFVIAIILFISGIVLTRVDLFGVRLEVNQPALRGAAYWLHVIAPIAAVWLFVLHRMVGRPIKWKVGFAWAGVAVVFAAGMLYLQGRDPRAWNMVGPESGEQYFFPSLSRTATGNFIPAKVLRNDAYCKDCHIDVHESWSASAHRFSSFNNPAYLFSVKGTRKAMLDRDGHVRGSRFCAGCHDPVPFFSGAFDDPKFDDPNYDLENDEFANAGITCTVCHSISNINSVRGNSDYTITEPIHYPFAFTDGGFAKWVNHQLIKAKPEFHKATFLKPLHKSTEFCGTCHKVHLPPELNAYKWLRGQNHYDAFWLSGVSGQGITSFYYPPKAQPNCNGCHMPFAEATSAPNFGAKVREGSKSDKLQVTDHQFPSANTAIVYLKKNTIDDPEKAMAKHFDFLKDVVRVDLFGIKKGGRIDGELIAPLRPMVPELARGETYLMEAVIRTMKMGHLFTQGTADSNEVWMEVTVRDGERVIGKSGGRREKDNEVDPWSHYVNAFVIDREGNRINRRNAEDIFVPLYNNQIPPGAADSVHYRFTVPENAVGPIVVEAKLHYRKFDTEYMRFVTGDPNYVNELPVVMMAEDSITFPVSGGPEVPEAAAVDIPEWIRWNDYGIGLLRKGKLGELRQARHAFEMVERLGKADGALNQARTFIKEGLVGVEAPQALARAASMEPPANAWSLLWFGAEVASRNGDYERTVANIEEILRGGFEGAVGRNFDFSKDYRVQNALGSAIYQVALQQKGEARLVELERARAAFQTALDLDPENLSAHYGLKQVYRLLGDKEKEAYHAANHSRYKPDDNARDAAVSKARLRYPAANHAAEDIVIYDLQRSGAIGLPVLNTGGGSR